MANFGSIFATLTIILVILGLGVLSIFGALSPWVIGGAILTILGAGYVAKGSDVDSDGSIFGSVLSSGSTNSSTGSSESSGSVSSIEDHAEGREEEADTGLGEAREEVEEAEADAQRGEIESADNEIRKAAEQLEQALKAINESEVDIEEVINLDFRKINELESMLEEFEDSHNLLDSKLDELESILQNTKELMEQGKYKRALSNAGQIEGVLSTIDNLIREEAQNEKGFERDLRNIVEDLIILNKLISHMAEELAVGVNTISEIQKVAKYCKDQELLKEYEVEQNQIQELIQKLKELKKQDQSQIQSNLKAILNELETLREIAEGENEMLQRLYKMWKHDIYSASHPDKLNGNEAEIGDELFKLLKEFKPVFREIRDYEGRNIEELNEMIEIIKRELQSYEGADEGNNLPDLSGNSRLPQN